MSFARENFQYSIWMVEKFGETNFRNFTFLQQFLPIGFQYLLDKFLRFISGGTGVNWVCQFLLIPAYLENETSKTALKLRSSDVTTKYVEVL